MTTTLPLPESAMPAAAPLVRVLSEAQVQTLLDLPRLVDGLAAAHASLSAGTASNPHRQRADAPGGALAAMPGFVPGVGLGLKALTSFRGSQTAGRAALQATVLLCSETDGRLLAIMAGRHLTAARTACAGALSTRLLARPDVRTLAVIGGGLQAPYHIFSTLAVRPSITSVRIASRTQASAARIHDQLAGSCPVPITVYADPESAVRGADVVIATTTSHTPVVLDSWISPGTHVVSVCSIRETTQELDPALIVRSRFVVDARSALHELGDYLVPLAEGLIGPEHVTADLGELVNGTHPGRQSHEEVTVYKSAGVAIQDLAAAALVYHAALAHGVGTDVIL